MGRKHLIATTVISAAAIFACGVALGIGWGHGLPAYMLGAAGIGAALLFIAGMFLGIGWGYSLGHNAGAEEEAAFADPTSFWAKQQEAAAPNDDEWTRIPGGYQMKAERLLKMARR